MVFLMLLGVLVGNCSGLRLACNNSKQNGGADCCRTLWSAVGRSASSIGHRGSGSVDVVDGRPVRAAAGHGVDALFNSGRFVGPNIIVFRINLFVALN